jgi:hypothetical protein
MADISDLSRSKNHRSNKKNVSLSSFGSKVHIGSISCSKKDLDLGEVESFLKKI